MSDAFEKAMRETWQMIDPLRPCGQPGSYARGEYNGIVSALRTIRQNYERAAKDDPDTCQGCKGAGGTMPGGPCAECYGQRTYSGARQFLETAAISDESLKDGVRIAQLEGAIRRALESLCGDYPSMAADLRDALGELPEKRKAIDKAKEPRDQQKENE